MASMRPVRPGLICGRVIIVVAASVCMVQAQAVSPSAVSQAVNQAVIRADSQADNPAGITWAQLGQPPLDQKQVGNPQVGRMQIAQTETTIGQFRRFVQARSQALGRPFLTRAERLGGGEVYAAGWVQQPGWTWQAPFGAGYAAHDQDVAVHLTYTEAQAFCQWAGGRLPTDKEWLAAAYTEQRPAPPAPWQAGRTYAYPTGDSPQGAQCLGDCGAAAAQRAVPHRAALDRGHGPARAGSTNPGVNGLYDMGANVWEWVAPDADPQDAPLRQLGQQAEGADAAAQAAWQAMSAHQRGTRGGSWWYGQAQMRAEYVATKPAQTAVVYIGFRCVR